MPIFCENIPFHYFYAGSDPYRGDCIQARVGPELEEAAKCRGSDARVLFGMRVVGSILKRPRPFVADLKLNCLGR